MDQINDATLDAAIVRTCNALRPSFAKHEPGCTCNDKLDDLVNWIELVREHRGPNKTAAALFALHTGNSGSFDSIVAGLICETVLHVIVEMKP